MDSQPKLRIGMLISQLHAVGGAQRQCQRLTEELVRKGHQVFVVTERLKTSPKAELISAIPVSKAFFIWELRSLGKSVKQTFEKLMQFIMISKGKSRNDERAELDIETKKATWYIYPFYKAMWRPLTFYIPMFSFMFGALWLFWKRRIEYDLINVHEAHHIAFIGVIIGKLLNKKVIITKQTVESFDWEKARRHLLGKLMLSFTLKAADCYVAISKQIEQELQFHQKERKFIIAPIPNGVDIPLQKPTVNRNSYLTYVGRLSYEKGVDILLQAWSLCNNIDRIKLILVGDGPKRADLEAKARHLNLSASVNFAGSVQDVSGYLLKTRIFVLPSRVEGMPIALLEAMSFGLPCIATGVGGSEDLIENEVTGLIVEPEDPAMLAQAIDYMIQNPQHAAAMGKKGRELIETRYDIKLIAKQYIELYRSLREEGR